MANCEKCGKRIEDGAVFCTACMSVLDTQPTIVSGVDETQKAVEHEVFSFKARSSKLIILKRLLLIIVCGLMAIIGLVSITADTISPDIPLMILANGIIVIGVMVVFLIVRSSQQDPFLPLSIGLLILTLGGTMVLPEYSNLILSIGLILVGFILVLLLFHHSDRNRPLFLALVIVILSLGMSMAVSEISTFLLGVSFILIGFLILITYL